MGWFGWVRLLPFYSNEIRLIGCLVWNKLGLAYRFNSIWLISVDLRWRDVLRSLISYEMSCRHHKAMQNEGRTIPKSSWKKGRWSEHTILLRRDCLEVKEKKRGEWLTHGVCGTRETSCKAELPKQVNWMPVLMEIVSKSAHRNKGYTCLGRLGIIGFGDPPCALKIHKKKKTRVMTKNPIFRRMRQPLLHRVICVTVSTTRHGYIR